MTRDEIAAWLAQAKLAALSTISIDDAFAGYPYGSLVTFALDDDNHPLLWLSDLAVHTQNLHGDPRCSLLVANPDSRDALASWRVTLIGRASIDDKLRDRFFSRHPDAAQLPGFHVWRVEVAVARYVAGFGKMGSVSW